MENEREKDQEWGVAYNDKLDSRTSCCLAGYLTSYRATMALS